MNENTVAAASANIDEAFGSLPRLKVAAFLMGCDEAEFAAVADAARTSASVLSKAATFLEDAGYVAVRKGHVGRRPRTWLAMTPSGRSAFTGHLAALRELTELAQQSEATPTEPERAT